MGIKLAALPSVFYHQTLMMMMMLLNLFIYDFKFVFLSPVWESYPTISHPVIK